MQPKLLMICIILRSSAAAFATPYSRRSGLKLGGCMKNAIARGGGGNNVRTAVTIIDDEYNNNEASSSSSTSTSLHQTSRRNAASSYYETTTSNNSPPINNNNNEQISNKISTGHIAYRLARRSDITQIQSVNLSTLPENYNSNFYINHMRNWPELTLVAEHIPEGYDSTTNDSEEEDDGRITPLRDYIRGKKQQQQLYNQNSSSSRPQKEIVGYILGKIEPRPIHPPQRQIFSSPAPPMTYNNRQDERSSTLMQYINGNGNNNGRGSSVRFPSSIRDNNRYNKSQQQSKQPYERIGHVTSLAIHKHARRLGIATQLINQLHYNLQTCYNAHSIGLHVRISNEAAVQLYVEGGYNVDDIIPCYYEDGEDAYFMRKDFEIESSDLVQVSENIPLYQPPQSQQTQQQPSSQGEKRWRRGEKERNDFFNSRTSMRDTMSDEERAWVNRNNSNNVMSAAAVARGYNNNNNNMSRRPTTTSSSSSSSISGQFKQRVFSTFFNTNSSGSSMQSSSAQQWRQQQRYNRPPWEVGPEELRLPRYIKVCGRDEQQSLQQPKQQATAGAGSQ